jgi:hypothetical protein
MRGMNVERVRIVAAAIVWAVSAAASAQSKSPGDRDPPLLLEEGSDVRVTITWHDGQPLRLCGAKTAETPEELERLLLAACEDARARRVPSPKLVAADDGRTPWREIKGVIDAAKRVRLDRIAFVLSSSPRAAGAPPMPIDTGSAEATPSGSGPTVARLVHRAPSGCRPFSALLPCADESHWQVEVDDRPVSWAEVAVRLGALASSGRAATPALVVRANELAPYAVVQRLIDLCSHAGAHRIQISTAKAPVAK